MAWLHDIDPVALQLGPLQIHWYGLMYIAGAAAVWWLGQRRLRVDPWRGMQRTAFDDLLFFGMIGVIAGGRLGYMFFYGWTELANDPLSMLRVWEGGMSFHGGLLGVIVALLWYARRSRRHPFDYLDFVAPLVPLALGLGRLGNFIGGELWGRTTDVAWAVIFPKALPMAISDQAELMRLHASGALDAYARHPSQLYQAGLEGVLMFLLLYGFTRQRRPRFAASGVFLILYGGFRSLVELVREPDAHIGFLAFDWLTMGQLLSLPMVALGIAMLWWAYRKPSYPAPVQEGG